MAVAAEDDVNVPCEDWVTMQRRWDLPIALRGGTFTMRERAQEFLPIRIAEKEQNWQSRVRSSVLYEAYSDTVSKIAARPFKKPVTVPPDMPAQLAAIERDADMAGTSLTGFAHKSFEVSVDRGLVHAIVDFPRMPGSIAEDGVTEVSPAPTFGQEVSSGLHPYFSIVDPLALIGWRWTLTSGRPVLTQARIRQRRAMNKGRFGVEYVNYVRVWYSNKWEDWREKDGAFVLERAGNHTFGEVPLRTYYVNSTGYMTGSPELEDLAWLNLRHFQSYSQQTTILDVVRSAILLRLGFSEEELKQPVVSGAHATYGSVSERATMSWVEHTGAGTDAGFKDLAMTEDRMETLGNQPFTKQAAASTAKGKEIDEDRAISEAQSWVRDLESWLGSLYHLAAKVTQQELPDDFAVDVFSDFELGAESTAELQALERLHAKGLLTDEQLAAEFKRRGILSSNVDVPVMLEIARNQAATRPVPGLPGLFGEPEEAA